MAKKRKSKKLRREISPDEVSRLAEFDRNLVSLTPVTPGVFVLIAISTLLFVAAAVSAGELAEPLPDNVLKNWGASSGELSRPHGGWRLFASIFVHAGMLQLLFNGWTLLDLGRFMERVLGSIGFVLVFIVTGFCANLASLVVQPDHLIAGSTGAIFGLLGALAGFVLRFRPAFPPGALARLRKSVPAFIAFNVGYGLIVKNLHSADYLGGLLCGLVCGLLLARPLTLESAALRWRSNLLLGILGLALMLGTGWAMAPRANLLEERAQLAELDERLTKQYQADRVKYEAKDMSQSDLAEAIDEQLLPDWRQARIHLETLEGVAPKDRKRWKDLKQYAKLRQQAWELLADGLRLGEDEAIAEAEKKEAEAARLAEKIAQEDKQQ